MNDVVLNDFNHDEMFSYLSAIGSKYMDFVSIQSKMFFGKVKSSENKCFCLHCTWKYMQLHENENIIKKIISSLIIHQIKSFWKIFSLIVVILDKQIKICCDKLIDLFQLNNL